MNNSDTVSLSQAPSFFQRILLPGFAFKAVVIGGGYATGRELVEFFFPAGPIGGLVGLGFVALIWSLVCTMTFLVARKAKTYDYRSFFGLLLGPFWGVFEVAYILLMLLVLSVFGAAAGEIFSAAFGLPAIAGTLALMIAIIVITALGRHAMEQMFKYVTIFLYLTYVIFVVLVLSRFGDRMTAALATSAPIDGWFSSGLTYAGYNIVGAVVILPMARHITSRKDAVMAGMLCGPFAALPAFLFFLCLLAFYPAIGSSSLPSDTMLTSLNLPLFHIIFQLMILSALLESGSGLVFALNERLEMLAEKRGRPLSMPARMGISTFVLVLAVVVAARVGLVTLIAQGYGWSAYFFLAIYVLPLFLVGGWFLLRADKARPLPWIKTSPEQ